MPLVSVRASQGLVLDDVSVDWCKLPLRGVDQLLVERKHILSFLWQDVCQQPHEELIVPARVEGVVDVLMNVPTIHSIAVPIDDSANDLGAVNRHLLEKVHTQGIGLKVLPCRCSLLRKHLLRQLICPIVPGWRGHGVAID